MANLKQTLLNDLADKLTLAGERLAPMYRKVSQGQGPQSITDDEIYPDDVKLYGYEAPIEAV